MKLRNFQLIKKVPKSRRKRKQYSLQPVRSAGAQQVTNINCYVIQMLSASLGLKLVDATRRILMYTKETDENKLTYAICRGTFPIHELCGTMTALLLARRDVLGVNIPLWKILGPAVLLHGMANFRGMKVSMFFAVRKCCSELFLILTSYSRLVCSQYLNGTHPPHGPKCN
jgi:hypothetical protein